MTPSRRSLLLGAAALALAPLAALVPGSPAMAEITYASDGIAIQGTDPVAYFTEGAPVAGSPEHEVEWNGATWRFASAENADAFRADPVAYAPAYGGYCAWAAAQGDLAPTDPDNWTIHEGRLFLNYDDRIQRRWERDIPGFVTRADANWPELSAR